MDAGFPLDELKAAFRPLNLPIEFKSAPVRRSGLEGLKVDVTAPPETASRYLPEIRELIEKADTTPRARELAVQIFENLGRAEARAHGIPIEKVHFHEVGALDSIADILGVAIGVDFLGLKRISFSAIPPGSGSVKCEHGLMPVPTPATAFLLEGVPLAQSPAAGELTTPTGAAIVKTLADEFGALPAMTLHRVGCGAGTKTFISHPNMVRLFVGERTQVGEVPSFGPESDQVVLLQTNLDDVSSETIGFVLEQLMTLGALDAWVTPIVMKKSRPAHELSALASEGQVAAIETEIFAQTRSLGIRRAAMSRSKLPRKILSVTTSWGEVRGKLRSFHETTSFHPEFDDCARLARAHGIPLVQVQKAALDAYMTAAEIKTAIQ